MRTLRTTPSYRSIVQHSIAPCTPCTFPHATAALCSLHASRLCVFTRTCNPHGLLKARTDGRLVLVLFIKVPTCALLFVCHSICLSLREAHTTHARLLIRIDVLYAHERANLYVSDSSNLAYPSGLKAFVSDPADT